MKFVSMIFVSIMFTLGFVQVAFAGDKGNAGDGFLIPDGTVRFLDLVRVPEAEIIEPASEGLRQALENTLRKKEGFSVATYYPAHWQERTTSVLNKIMSALDSLEFVLVPGPLPETNDRGVVVLPWNIEGRIVRLALQNRSSHKVIIDRNYYNQMPFEDRVAFMEHESLIRVWFDDPTNKILETTEKISSLVSATFDQSTRYLSSKSVAGYLCRAGITSGANSEFNMRSIPEMRSQNISFPDQVIFAYRKEGICHVQKANLHGPAQGYERNLSTRPFQTAVTWMFKAKERSHADIAFSVISKEIDRFHQIYSMQLWYEVQGLRGVDYIESKPVPNQRFGIWTH